MFSTHFFYIFRFSVGEVQKLFHKLLKEVKSEKWKTI
jgi:hypothetical protein